MPEQRLSQCDREFDVCLRSQQQLHKVCKKNKISQHLEVTSGAEEPWASPFSWELKLWVAGASLPAMGHRDSSSTKTQTISRLCPEPHAQRAWSTQPFNNSATLHHKSVSVQRKRCSKKHRQETQQKGLWPYGWLEGGRLLSFRTTYNSSYLFLSSFQEKMIKFVRLDQTLNYYFLSSPESPEICSYLQMTSELVSASILFWHDLLTWLYRGKKKYLPPSLSELSVERRQNKKHFVYPEMSVTMIRTSHFFLVLGCLCFWLVVNSKFQ